MWLKVYMNGLFTCHVENYFFLYYIIQNFQTHNPIKEERENERTN